MGEKVYGFHAIEEALKKAGMGSTLYVQRQGGERIESLVREAKLTGKVAVKKLSKDELERMMPGADVRGAILDLGGPRRGASRLIETTVEEFCDRLGENDGALVLILDGITDPHNLGAILRSADQFGVDLVLIPERRSVQANETVVKVSSGAAQYVPLAVVPKTAALFSSAPPCGSRAVLTSSTLSLLLSSPDASSERVCSSRYDL